MIIHYVYKITNVETKQYYIRKSSCFGLPENDEYFGSGTWIRKTAKKLAGLRKIPAFATKKHFYGNPEYVKEILKISYNAIENLNNEYLILGDLWISDILCMNKKTGGIGFCGADKHPRYDQTKYIWFHYENKEKIIKTQYEMFLYLGGHRCSINSCVKQNKSYYKSVKGWYFCGSVENPVEPDFSKSPDYKKYEWRNVVTNEIVNVTRKEVQLLFLVIEKELQNAYLNVRKL